MGGPVEFNLLHCLGGMGLAIGSGFLLDLVIRRRRAAPATKGSVEGKVTEPTLAA